MERASDKTAIPREPAPSLLRSISPNPKIRKNSGPDCSLLPIVGYENIEQDISADRETMDLGGSYAAPAF
jgi:hypothetical protein